ncbi:hypothetical protein [Leisingera caerulea]|uniref:hypothetical protein n=1 Tax=Leisingera caerulea TaxID=506591 RepID=UPI0012B50D1F|nr:hypothetical protein [Leisingera caerulea]UWQ82754.1 hypothetical protein K3726_13830 [Leisingera caerulea]
MAKNAFALPEKPGHHRRKSKNSPQTQGNLLPPSRVSDTALPLRKRFAPPESLTICSFAARRKRARRLCDAVTGAAAIVKAPAVQTILCQAL